MSASPSKKSLFVADSGGFLPLNHPTAVAKELPIHDQPTIMAAFCEDDQSSREFWLRRVADAARRLP